MVLFVHFLQWLVVRRKSAAGCCVDNDENLSFELLQRNLVTTAVCNGVIIDAHNVPLSLHCRKAIKKSVKSVVL